MEILNHYHHWKSKTSST